jgi:hypothetical protein
LDWIAQDEDELVEICLLVEKGCDDGKHNEDRERLTRRTEEKWTVFKQIGSLSYINKQI